MNGILFDEIDLTEDREALDRISETGRVLDSYYDEISRTGGISRADAVTLVNEYGVMLGERYPPQSFTEVASRTNLSVTLEAILERAGALLMQLLKKAAELLLKIVTWIRDLLQNRIARMDNAISKAKGVGAVQKASADLKAAGTSQIKTDDSTTALENAVKLALETYENNFTDLVADIIVEESFSRTVRSMAFGVLGILDPLQAKVALLNTIIHRHRAPSLTADISEVGELRTVAMPIPAQRLLTILRAGGMEVQNPGSATIEDIMSSLMARYTELRTKNSYDPVNIDIVAAHLTTGKHAIAEPFFLKPKDIADTTANLTKQLSALQRIQPSNAAPPANRDAFNEAIKTLSSEIRALRLLVSVAEGCSMTQERLIDDIWKYNEADFILQRGKVVGSGDADLIQTVNRIQKELRETIRRITGK